MKTVRNPSAEEGFKREYNLVVTVEQGRECNPDGTFKQTQAIIKSASGKEYQLNEFLKGNLTDYVIATANDEDTRFTSYKEAEKFIAEEIRKES